MKKSKNKFPKSIKVLAFNCEYKLVGIYSSFNACEKMTRTQHQIITRCCNGDLISSHGHYWRELSDDIIIDSDDLGKLTLFDFDREVGNDLLVYSTKTMGKRGKIIKESEHPMW